MAQWYNTNFRDQLEERRLKRLERMRMRIRNEAIYQNERAVKKDNKNNKLNDKVSDNV
jgi:hypothetical protein